MKDSNLIQPQRSFTLLEVVLAMFILAGALTALLGERQRSVQHSRRIVEQRYALRLASAWLDQSQCLGELTGVLAVPENFHLEMSDVNISISEVSEQNFVERTVKVVTPSGEYFQLSRVLSP